MKNIITVFACVAVVALMTACGGGNASKQSDNVLETKAEVAESSGTEIKDIDKTNWQAVIKANRGVDIPVPDGWRVESAKPDRGTNITVVFNIGGSTTAEQFGQMLMDATKAAASNGNHSIEITERGTAEGEAIGTISEASMITGGSVYEWCFTTKYVYQVHYYVDNEKKQAALNI